MSIHVNAMKPTFEMMDRILYAYQGAAVQRYHTWRTIKPQDVGQHTYGVIFFLTQLYPNGVPNGVLLEAIAHDLPEQKYGDIPAPAKRALNGSAYRLQELEDELNSAQGMGSPLSQGDKRLLKMADVLDGMMYCVQEKILGNLNMGIVYHRFHSYVQELEPKGVELLVILAVESLWERT